MNDNPRITFGIIVLNGEPFTRYTLRALYPFAHEIIVVEGAAPAAADVATPDGHSTDGTLEVLHQFKAEEDLNDKLIIITKDGFWTEKDEMSQAYAQRATGDYLWQVDVDEFYLPDDMQAIIQMLRDDPEITAISFKTLTFWGSPDFIVDGWHLRRGASIYHRLFKWGEEYTYVTHRPPTVMDSDGRDLRDMVWMNAKSTAQYGLLMYHYSLLFPKQVLEKSQYYGRADWARRAESERWAKEAFLNLEHPFRVHNIYSTPSWLMRYNGEHNPEILRMWEDVQYRDDIQVRDNADVERLLNSMSYRMTRFGVKYLDYLVRAYHFLQRSLEPIKNPIKKAIGYQRARDS